MEDNKPFMPPPPPKMPPPPPRDQVTEKPEVQANQGNETVVTQQSVQDENANVGTPSVDVLETAKETEKKVPQSKEQKKSKLFTALYWGGFILCLAGIALCIFFLVK